MLAMTQKHVNYVDFLIMDFLKEHILNNIRELKEGGSGLSLRKNDFELGVGGESPDTSRQYCPREASEQKLGQKQKS